MRRVRFSYVTKIMDFDNYDEACNYIKKGVQKGYVFESKNHEFSSQQEKLDVDNFIFEHQDNYMADLFNELPNWKKDIEIYYSVKFYMKLNDKSQKNKSRTIEKNEREFKFETPPLPTEILEKIRKEFL